eukprot:NODE_731_length_1943_cov_24.215945_g677_i0.p1 GENE.NODE_731_length_1943_cov_24.215945_g677_i0~~NODE_731_length_1943_cov_24.215945_g677_i0.p1  ORF type:complete len:582 (-),score=135.19 NODE_731_length_1943_cov_24.215945_g677_i0:124-1869(-)
MDPSSSSADVLPLLCRHIHRKSQPFQNLALRSFEQELKCLSRVRVRKPDAEQFVGVLFKTAQRTQGSTDFEVSMNVELATIALRIMYKLYTQRHGHFPTFIEALSSLMKRLKLDDEHFYKRPVTPDHQTLVKNSNRSATPQSPSSPEVQNFLNAPDEEPVLTLSAPDFFSGLFDKLVEDEGFDDDDDMAETIAGLPTSSATDLSYDDLCRLKAVFDELDEDGSGELSFNELMELSDQTGRDFNMQMFKKLDKDGNGLISFIEIVRAWFPKVSLKELTRKVASLPTAGELKKRREKEAIAISRRKDAEMRRMREREETKRGAEELLWRESLDTKRRAEALDKDDERQQRWQQFTSSPKRSSLPPPEQVPSFIEVSEGVKLTPTDFHLDFFLERNETRGMVVELLKVWDLSSINACFFVGKPTLHLYLPVRFQRRAAVFRDYITCPPRSQNRMPWEGIQSVHIKTNIKVKSDIMYHFVVEGYNYGVNAPIHSEISGYAHRRWNKLGAMEDFGWPDGWDAHIDSDHAMGAHISQYISHDGCIVIKLTSKSFFNVGFSVSAYLLHHDYGADFVISSTIHHDNVEL